MNIIRWIKPATIGLSMAVLVGLIVAISAASTRASSHEPVQHGPMETQLQTAKDSVTFSLRQPSWLPEGTSLQNVGWDAPGQSRPADAGFSSVDLWYALPDGRRLHIWQTDREDIHERGRHMSQYQDARMAELSNGTWWERSLTDRNPSTSVIGRTYADGVTVQVSASDATELVRRVAASMSRQQ